MEKCIDIMKDEILRLAGSDTTIYIYGSVALKDFRPGWSDIDLLCLTTAPLAADAADELLGLRQRLRGQYGQPLFRAFEGGILDWDSFLSGRESRVVYWGTSGQRIADRHHFDCFSMTELLNHGIVVTGTDRRGQMTPPMYEDLREGVIRHYEVIRKYAVQVGESITSCGWLLDIARCIFTLKTGQVIAKTQAGEWALEAGICPAPQALARAIEIRKSPLSCAEDSACLAWCGRLGGDIQQFADVLQQEIAMAAGH